MIPAVKLEAHQSGPCMWTPHEQHTFCGVGTKTATKCPIQTILPFTRRKPVPPFYRNAGTDNWCLQCQYANMHLDSFICMVYLWFIYILHTLLALSPFLLTWVSKPPCMLCQIAGLGVYSFLCILFGICMNSASLHVTEWGQGDVWHHIMNQCWLHCFYIPTHLFYNDFV